MAHHSGLQDRRCRPCASISFRRNHRRHVQLRGHLTRAHASDSCTDASIRKHTCRPAKHRAPRVYKNGHGGRAHIPHQTPPSISHLSTRALTTLKLFTVQLQLRKKARLASARCRRCGGGRGRRQRPRRSGRAGGCRHSGRCGAAWSGRSPSAAPAAGGPPRGCDQPAHARCRPAHMTTTTSAVYALVHRQFVSRVLQWLRIFRG